MKVTCIIPSTCSREVYPHLSKCISSLRLSQTKNISLRIVIVTANLRPYLFSIKKYINKIITVPAICGFARMNNLAIEETLSGQDPDYYLLINDDAWVLKDFLSEFDKAAKKQKAEIIVPLVYENKGTRIDSYGVEYFNSGYAMNAISQNTPTSLASAGCLIIKVSLFKRMEKSFGAYFNEMLNAYYEDVEFSIRARALGAKILKVQKMIARHVGSFTSGKKSRFVLYQTYRNVFWVILLTWPLGIIVRNIFRIIILQGWFLLYSSFRFGPGFYIELLIDTAKNLKVLIKQRKRNLNNYSPAFKFEDIFNGLTFRTGKGAAI